MHDLSSTSVVDIAANFLEGSENENETSSGLQSKQSKKMQQQTSSSSVLKTGFVNSSNVRGRSVSQSELDVQIEHVPD